MGLQRVQLQLLEHLNDRVEANGVERLDGSGSLCQLSLHYDDEVQAFEVHVRAWDPADAMASHPRPDVDVETRKKPLPGVPTVDVSNHWLVNLYLRI